VDVGWFLPGPEGCGGAGVRLVELVLVGDVELELPVEVVLVVDVVELDVLELKLELLVEVGVELVVDEGVELVVDELVVDELVVDEPVVDEPVVDEPVVDEPVVDEPVVDEPVVDEPLVVGGAQLIVSEMTAPVIGSDSDETGVPAGTLTGNVNSCPPSSSTVTVHTSAEAFGIAASPSVTTAEVAATISFRLPNTAACPSYIIACAWNKRRDDTATLIGRY
jgi:hypothetical protein